MTQARERHTPGAGWRDRVRRQPGGVLLLKTAALVVGVALIGLGLVLVVLPGPLTIPPILLGLYVLSLEFAWADRLFRRAQVSGRAALAATRARPVSSAIVTVGGLVMAGAVIWAVGHYHVVGRVRDVLGF